MVYARYLFQTQPMNNSGVRNRAPVPMTQCGLVAAVEVLGDRWTMLILRECLYGVVRFADILADIKIPRSVLSKRLKILTDANILKLVPYQEEGTRTRNAYVLTESGKALALPVLALMQWGDRHLRSEWQPASIIDRTTGNTLDIGFVDGNGRIVPAVNVEIKTSSSSEHFGN